MLSNGATKWYLGAGLAAVLVLVAGWFLLISPQRTSADEITQQAEAQVAANAATDRQIATLKAQYKDLPSLQEQLAAVRARMPQAPQLPTLLRSLTSNATSAGVKLNGVTPAVPTPVGGGNELAASGGVNQVSVQLDFEGKFSNVRLYLASLEALPRSFLVSDVNITRDDQKASDGIAWLKVSVKGAVFTANPGLPAGAAATTTTATGAAAGTAATAS